MRDKQQIEAMYYLSPLQQGLLFHRLADAEADPYFYQYAYRLQGDLRLDAFEGAWRHVVERHAVLRTAFVWEGVEKPLQVVRRQTSCPSSGMIGAACRRKSNGCDSRLFSMAIAPPGSTYCGRPSCDCTSFARRSENGCWSTAITTSFWMGGAWRSCCATS
jgi:hypothetical protein